MGEMDRPFLVIAFGLFLAVIALTPPCSSTCTYPSDLDGVWHTSHETQAELTWSGGNVTSFTYTATGSTFTGITFECYINDGKYFVSKSTGTILIFNAPFKVYTCWVFTKISSDKYLYRQSVTPEPGVNGARVKVFTEATTITQASEICDDTDYENNHYSILLRNGTASDQKTQCPSPLLATGQYTITDDSGTDYCNLNSWLDGCTDKSTLTANYTLCNTELFYSSGGIVYCMYSTKFSSAESSTYYTTLFNADSSPDQSSTYYFTCAVSDATSSGVYITYYPGDCLNGTYQNATYISESNGFSVLLNSNTTCVPTSPTDNLPLILGVVFGFLFLIGLIILFVYLYYVKVYVPGKRRTSRAGSKVVPDTLPNTAMSQGDKNYRMMFTPAPPKSAGPGGRHHEYRDGGLYGSQTSIRPPVSQLAFYRTPTPRISDSKVPDESSHPQAHPSDSNTSNHAGNELADNINKESNSPPELPTIAQQNDSTSNGNPLSIHNISTTTNNNTKLTESTDLPTPQNSTAGEEVSNNQNVKNTKKRPTTATASNEVTTVRPISKTKSRIIKK